MTCNIFFIRFAYISLCNSSAFDLVPRLIKRHMNSRVYTTGQKHNTILPTFSLYLYVKRHKKWHCWQIYFFLINVSVSIVLGTVLNVLGYCISFASIRILKYVHFMKTCLYNFDPLKAHFYIVKLGFTGVYIIFLNFAQKHRLWVLVRTASSRRF